MRYITIIVISALLVAVGAGCGKGQESVQPHHNAQPDASSRNSTADKKIAIPSADDVQMVIYHAAAYWSIRPNLDLKGEPKSIINREYFVDIVDAVINPDGYQQSREVRNDRLAIIAKNGDIVMFGITPPSGYYACGISSEHSSKKLCKTLLKAVPQAQVVRLELGSPIKSMSYSEAGRKKQLDLRAVEKPLGELLKLYKPLALQGNRRCSIDEITAHAKDYPDFLIIKLAKPDSFDAVVVVRDAGWPPETYNTNTKLERIKFDTITIFDEIDDQVRFVFSDSKSGRCLYTDPVKAQKLIKKAEGKIPATYGPNLFNELISAR